MYTLRKLFPDGTQGNTAIGTHYSVILKDRAEKPFNETSDILYKGTQPEGVYGFVVTTGGEEIIPLCRKQFAFIMSPYGRTFDNLTHHDDK